MLIDESTKLSLILNPRVRRAITEYDRLHRAYTLCFQPIDRKLDDEDINEKVKALIKHQDETIAIIADEAIKRIFENKWVLREIVQKIRSK